MRKLGILLILIGLNAGQVWAVHDDGFDRDDFQGPIEQSIAEDFNNPNRVDTAVQAPSETTPQSPVFPTPAGEAAQPAANEPAKDISSIVTSVAKKTDDSTVALAGQAGQTGDAITATPNQGYRIPGTNLHLGAYIQLDYNALDQSEERDTDKPQDATFQARRARLEFSTEADTYTGHLSMDVADSLQLKDAYVNWLLDPRFQLQFGQFKNLIGNETQASAKYAIFMESSPIAALMGGQRDRGILVHNQADASDYFYYALGVMNGSPENEADNNSELDWVGRFVLHSPSDDFIWKTWLGVGYQAGAQKATSVTELSIRSESSGIELFRYDILDTVKYQRELFSLDGVIQRGRYTVSGSYMRDIHTFDQPVIIDGGQFVFSAFLTNNEHEIDNGLISRQKINKGGSAMELAWRYAWFNVDELYFNPERPLYTGAMIPGIEQMQTGQSMTFAANWYLSASQRLSLDFVSSQSKSVTFDDLPDANVMKENAILLRFQSAF